MRFARLLVFGIVVAATPARAQTEAGASPARRVYEGVVDWKQKTIGTLILMDVKGSSISGWIRLEKFAPIESGSIGENAVEFRAAGNSYKIDERRGRIIYSGPDGSGDRIITRLQPITGEFQEMTEGERFTGVNVITLEVDGRLRRYNVAEPSLWKNEGPPFEKFERVDLLLQKQLTLWVSDPDRRSGVEIIEEPSGMNIPLKPPKPTKEEKERRKKEEEKRKEEEKQRPRNRRLPI